MSREFQRSRERARLWRQGGMPLPEICERLGVGKTTAYYWIKDLPRLKTRTALQTETQKIATLAMQEKFAAARKQSYDVGLSEAKVLLDDLQVRDFVVLFLCEGHRKSRNMVSVTNTNPALIRLTHRVLSRFSKAPVVFRLAYHRDVDVCSARRYWAQQLSISSDVIRTGKPKRDYDSPNFRHVHHLQQGIMQVFVCDTAFRQRIQGWCDFIQSRVW